MGAPKFREKPETPFARRVREALVHTGIDLAEAAVRLAKIVGRPIKPQTVQWMASKAKDSTLSADLAEVCGVRYKWLAHAEGPMVGPAFGKQPVDLEDLEKLLGDLEWALRATGKVAKVGGFAKMGSFLYRVWQEDGQRPSRAVILELVKNVA